MSFGLKGSVGIRVGKNSGWLFPGFSVHAMMDGVVVRFQHESSWGCLIAVQSRLRDNALVTVYYGHLSHRITLAPGDRVSMGEKIGEIAQSFTIDTEDTFPMSTLELKNLTTIMP